MLVHQNKTASVSSPEGDLDLRVYSGLYVGGEWREPSGQRFQVVNPSSGEVLASLGSASESDVEDATEAARGAFESGAWSLKGPSERAEVLLGAARLMQERFDELVEAESVDAGKPIRMARELDVPWAIDNLKFFAGAGRSIEGKAAGEYDAAHLSILRRDPVGVVASITPWNYPLLMAVWKLAPALVTGNCAVIKPALETPLTTMMFVQALGEAGAPPGVVNMVCGPGRSVGAKLVEDSRVRMVSLTGGTETGKEVMRMASSSLKRLHLELGGKAPFIVFADADLDAAATGAQVGGYINAGQDCGAACRVYVERSAYDDFLQAFRNRVESLVVGDTRSEQTDVGPLISDKQRSRVLGFLERAQKEGSKIVCGGRIPEAAPKGGFFLEPTIVVGSSEEAEIIKREVFGPVVTVSPFDSEEEVVEKANDVEYGLCASVWTNDVYKSMDVSRRLEVGTVWTNDHLALATEMPWGGWKQSGYGSDMSTLAIEEYTQPKHLMLDTTRQKVKEWYTSVFSSRALYH